jgi:PAS domain S-box-containing protein
MFGWGGDSSKSLEDENKALRARLQELQNAPEFKHYLHIDNAPCVVFGVGEDFKISSWNQEATRVMGQSRTEVEGKLLDIVFAENAGMFKSAIEASIGMDSTSSSPINVEVALPGKECKRIMLLSCRTRKDSAGHAVDTIFLGQDITERKHAEEEKIRLATELQTFIDVANAAIFGTDKSGRINEWNHQSAEITGLSKEEVMGKDFLQVLIEPEFQASLAQVLQSALEGRGTANFEFPFFTKDRRRVDVLLNATTRRDADGAIIGVIGVGQVIAGPVVCT